MKRISYLILILFFSTLASANVMDPWAYAENHSREYAKGDTGDGSGWQECREDEGYTAAKPKLLCTGERTIIVDQGKDRTTANFICYYEFELVSQAEGYNLTFELCN